MVSLPNPVFPSSQMVDGQRFLPIRYYYCPRVFKNSNQFGLKLFQYLRKYNLRNRIIEYIHI